MDNLIGHKNPAWLRWCFQRGILPIYTPIGGSWLNMAESIQRLLKRQALDRFYPQHVQIIMDLFEAVARGWNAHPAPFVWDGKRCQRRLQTRAKHLHPVGWFGGLYASSFGTPQQMALLITSNPLQWCCQISSTEFHLESDLIALSPYADKHPLPPHPADRRRVHVLPPSADGPLRRVGLASATERHTEAGKHHTSINNSSR